MVLRPTNSDKHELLFLEVFYFPIQLALLDFQDLTPNNGLFYRITFGV